MYVKKPTLFLGLGVLFIPISFVIVGLQWLLLTGLDAIGSVTGGSQACLASSRSWSGRR